MMSDSKATQIVMRPSALWAQDDHRAGLQAGWGIAQNCANRKLSFLSTAPVVVGLAPDRLLIAGFLEGCCAVLEQYLTPNRIKITPDWLNHGYAATTVHLAAEATSHFTLRTAESARVFTRSILCLMTAIEMAREVPGADCQISLVDHLELAKARSDEPQTSSKGHPTSAVQTMERDAETLEIKETKTVYKWD
jgi:hypothetical protein